MQGGEGFKCFATLGLSHGDGSVDSLSPDTKLRPKVSRGLLGFLNTSDFVADFAFDIVGFGFEFAMLERLMVLCVLDFFGFAEKILGIVNCVVELLLMLVFAHHVLLSFVGRTFI